MTAKKSRTEKLKKMGLTGTDADFDHPAYDKSLGRDVHGRPMLTIPRSLMVNEPPRHTPQKQATTTGSDE